MDDSAEPSRRARRILLATAVSWVLLAVGSGVWDLAISRAVVNAESGWGVFVAASRVVVGAHYLSDVVFSTGAAFAVTVPLCRRFCEHPVARTSALR